MARQMCRRPDLAPCLGPIGPEGASRRAAPFLEIRWWLLPYLAKPLISRYIIHFVCNEQTPELNTIVSYIISAHDTTCYLAKQNIDIGQYAYHIFTRDDHACQVCLCTAAKAKFDINTFLDRHLDYYAFPALRCTLIGHCKALESASALPQAPSINSITSSTENRTTSIAKLFDADPLNHEGPLEPASASPQEPSWKAPSFSTEDMNNALTELSDGEPIGTPPLSEMQNTYRVEPTAPRTRTVILFHGMDWDGETFARALFESMCSSGRSIREELPVVRWFFPNAPLRETDRDPKFGQSLWFDFYSLTDLNEANNKPDLLRQGLADTLRRVDDLITQVIGKAGTNSVNHRPQESEIVLGGFCLGMAAALFIWLCGDQQLAGFFIIRGWLPLVETASHDINARVPAPGSGTKLLG